MVLFNSPRLLTLMIDCSWHVVQLLALFVSVFAAKSKVVVRTHTKDWKATHCKKAIGLQPCKIPGVSSKYV